MIKSSAERKLEWGVKHLHAVCGEARAYENGKKYVLRMEPEARSPEEILYRCFAFQREPFPEHWPFVLGDALHNIRSSLDHAVYAAAKGKGRTQFPIFEDPCEFQVKGRKSISTVPKPVRALIEELQPFKAIPERPWSEGLAVLADLSNFDKHRDITPVALYAGVPWLSHDEIAGRIHITFNGEGSPMPPDKETHVMDFVVTGPEAEKVKVYPDFAYEVFIERVRRDRRRKDTVPLVRTLENVLRRVAYVLAVVEGRAPLSVWPAPAI